MRSISLTGAILLSINIIIGAGLFINPAPLTNIAQGWGFLAYLLGAIVILPLILCLSALATLKPSAGGLYVYAQSYVSPLAGFVSSWSYFLGKTTSASILALTFCTFLPHAFPGLRDVPPQILTMGLLFLLPCINILGLRIGGKIQWLFIFCKALPIAFVLCTGFLYAMALPDSYEPLRQLGSALPIAVFAYSGFEAICSVAHMIENPHKNVRRAMLISFFMVAVVYALFQYSMYQVLGPDLAHTPSPLFAYAQALLPNSHLATRILNALVFSSIIGASFGMLTSNCWNLHTIAKHGHLPFSKLLLPIKNQAPWMCLLVEAGLGSFIISVEINQISLQNMAVFGMTIAYFLSTLAALRAARSKETASLPRIIPLLSFISCSYILWLCAERILSSGASYIFLIVLGAGYLLAYMKSSTRKKIHTIE